MGASHDVLIVDDDDDLRETLVSALEDEGMTVASAHDGRDALDWLVAGGTPSVILLDFAMPNLDAAGFRRAQLADPRLASVPVILMSASRTFSIEGDPTPLPHLEKPMRLHELISLVETYTGPR
ncbi:MAG: response regulator [Polyangiaceae bacterium]